MSKSAIIIAASAAALLIVGAAADNYNLARTGQLQPNMWGFTPKAAAPSPPRSEREENDGRFVSLYRRDGLPVTITLHCPATTDDTECYQASLDFSSVLGVMQRSGFRNHMVTRSNPDLEYNVEVTAARNRSAITYSVETFGLVGTRLTLTNSVLGSENIEMLPRRLKSMHEHYTDAINALATHGANVMRVTTQP